MLATGEPAAAEGGQNETNLPWLLRLRWGALVGQLLTIVFVRYAMRSPIPIGPLFGVNSLIDTVVDPARTIERRFPTGS